MLFVFGRGLDEIIYCIQQSEGIIWNRLLFICYASF